MLRFAPSPTGYLHIGNARVAVLNYFYSLQKGLDFFLRIDDTDKERSDEKYVDAIKRDLSWLGIKFKKIVRQSERLESYKSVFELLKKKNLIYPCFETSEELALKRKVLLKQGKPPIYDRNSLNLKKSEISSLINSGKLPHWRLKLDDEPIFWNDKIHGDVKFDNLSISDPVLFRSDEMPLFTITSVVDDVEFNVSNILRGDDHITNTAAQIKLFRYLGSEVPNFGHFPLMRSKTGSGLSKRFNSFSLDDLRKRKIFPLIILNYLNKIGSNLSNDEIDDIDLLKKNFDLSSFSKNSVLFNDSDLERLNSKYLKTLTYHNLKKFFDVKYDEKFWDIIKNNVDDLKEIDEWYQILNFNHNQKTAIEPELHTLIKEYLPPKIDKDTWSIWTTKILEVTKTKPKDLYMKLRFILTGRNYGPSMNEMLTLYSREEILKRIESNCD
jgi:glutamyl-tRNA synthetase|tara:strand:- start:1939 stop:3258 length:1320 start_codon:yes stop_codon:yes gene_type:complete